MRLIVIVGALLLLNYQVDSSLLDPVIENVRHIKATHPPGQIDGMWKKKMLWKPRWIKEWKSSNVLKPIWKKFWGPVIIREWVPIPKPPPHWDAQPTPLETKPASGSPFIDSVEPPTPNFSYLPNPLFPTKIHNYQQPKQTVPIYNNYGNILNSGAYRSPPLPIASGYNPQVESYAGHSSYGSTTDSSSFDLNPPVEQYNPQQSGYDFKGASGSIIQSPYNVAPKPVVFPSHDHHHHHHHHHHPKPAPHIHHTHSSDHTRFPPDWSSWNSVPQKPYLHSQTQQGSSPVSVVSAVQSILPEINKQTAAQVSSTASHSGDDFIQKASLLSEYHYTESAPINHTLTTTVSYSSTPPVTQRTLVPTSRPIPNSVVHSNTPPFPHHGPILSIPPGQVSTHHPKTNSNLRNEPPPPLHPRHASSSPHQKAKKPSFHSSKVVSHVKQTIQKPYFPKEHKHHFNRTVKPVQFELQKVPDFKILPDSVTTFQFVDPPPSNQTVTKAVLIGDTNHTGSDWISITSPEKLPPYIAKLAEKVLEEDLKITQKENSSLQFTTEPSAVTEETKATVVPSTTSSSIKKTLKAYLAQESISEKTDDVFIVTPVPLPKGEI